MPMTAADLPAVCALDCEIFGADRSRLLASLLFRAPESAWILWNRLHPSEGPTAYCFGRPGFRYDQLGPIVARDREAAISLSARALAALEGRSVMIDAPVLDSKWIAWLQESAGFVEERPFLRMFRRGVRHPGVPSRQYAICGPEFA